jgi:hypothetical protein
MAQVEVFIGVFSRNVGDFVLLGKLSLVASLIHFDGHGDQNGLVIGNSIY